MSTFAAIRGAHSTYFYPRATAPQHSTRIGSSGQTSKVAYYAYMAMARHPEFTHEFYGRQHTLQSALDVYRDELPPVDLVSKIVAERADLHQPKLSRTIS